MQQSEMTWLREKIVISVDSRHGDVLQDLAFGENNPIGGTETATMNIATSLKRVGCDVEIVTDPANLIEKECDIFISCSRWEIFLEGLRPGRLNYFWCHDNIWNENPGPLYNPALADIVYSACDGVIFLSHYQQQRWLEILKVPVEKAFLSSNGIPLKKFSGAVDKLSYRLPWAYYSSIPSRGLEPLLAGWPRIKASVKDAQLHVFSSMQIYNQEDDDVCLKLYDQARNLDGVHYHGAVGQAQLRETAQMCRVLAYPCIVPETSCICAMEAMAAGCGVVSTNLGALPETAWRNPLVPVVDGWFSQWVFDVSRILVDDSYYERLARQNLITAQYYDWDAVALRWLERFRLDSIKRGGSE